MNRLKIGVLFGGCSSEHEISLQSAYAVITHMDYKKYEPVLIGITRLGEWFLFSGCAEKINNDTWNNPDDCVKAIISPDRKTHGVLILDSDNPRSIRLDAVFPVLHGKNGEDGTLQGLLEMAGIPCAGCGTLSSAICMDKDIAHKLVQMSGVKTPPSAVLYPGWSSDELLKITGKLSYPLYVKPANAGSSYGITMVLSPDRLPDAVEAAFQYDRKVVIEQAVEGFEVGCAVLGNSKLIIGEVDEIELSEGFFDYAEKYSLKTSKIHMPARIDPDTAVRVRQTAAAIYRVLGCRGFARVDMFLTPEKEIIFNEVNTIPGFTSHSRYPNMLGGVGMAFEEIVDAVIRLATAQDRAATGNVLPGAPRRSTFSPRSCK